MDSSRRAFIQISSLLTAAEVFEFEGDDESHITVLKSQEIILVAYACDE